MRVFLDANILFSASRSAGGIRSLLEITEGAGHILVVDPYVASEALRNVASKADGTCMAVLEAMLVRMTVQSIQATPAAGIDLGWLDAKDRPVLQAAMATRCDVLLTGDKKHFGQAFGRRYWGVLVCSAATWFALLRERKEA